VEDVLSRHGVKFSEKQITLKKSAPHDIGSLWADKEKLKEIITGILNNALKYTPPGGKIGFKLTADDSDMHFEISDTGPGIPKEALEKLFDEHASEKDQAEGLVNLALTRKIIELHRGRIWVESEPGKGSKFNFILPKDLRR
jgi:signal transduction histidine kinase